MAQRKSRSAQLNGLTSLSYVGVLPSSPTNFIIEQHPPSSIDWRNVYIGDTWLDNSSQYASPPSAPTGANLWVLVSIAGNSATWINFTSGAVASVGAGNLISISGSPSSPIVNVVPGVAAGFLTDDTLTAVPALNILTVHGAGGISTSSSGSTVTISGPGTPGVTWSVITASQSAVANNGYFINGAGIVTVTLPASSAVGDIIEVSGMNSGDGWIIAQNALQQIYFGVTATTVGTGGSLASTLSCDTVKIVCNVAGSSSNWNVISSIGNITVT